jgi:hypothetical protein
MQPHGLIALLIIILSTAVACAAESTSQTQKPPATAAQPAGAQEIHGELLMIDKDHCLLKDSFGKEVRLRITASTKLEGEPKAGDKVAVSVMEGGMATSIKKR